VVKVDLLNGFGKLVRIRGLRLASSGGGAGCDRIGLARTEKDPPPGNK
jgi:hypothetical protein